MSPSRRLLLEAGAFSVLVPGARTLYAQDAPTGPFGVRSTAEDVTAGLDLAGRTALITGCNSGIGYETMRVLALRGARVLGTARTARKGRQACESVAGDAIPLELELTDFDSIVECAAEVDALGRPLDMLICNAGVLLPTYERALGLEKQFVVNHLGHFVLVNRLLARLRAAPAGRIVVVGSTAHWSAPAAGIDFDGLGESRDYDPAQAYGQSKLANGLFSMELARRLAGSSVTSNVLHPGIVETNLYRHWSTRVTGGGGRKNVEEGAATSCYVAAHPLLAGVSGYYFEDCNPASPSPLMHDVELAAGLWAFSEEVAAGYLV